MDTDLKIWQAFKTGEKKALALIFQKNYASLHNYGVRICGDATLTEDCLQDFFIYLFEYRKNLSDVDNIRPYLFKSFRRVLLRQISKSGLNLFSLTHIDIPIPDIHFNKEDLMIRQEIAVFQNETLLVMLNKLPKRQREVIYLKYYNNMNIKEIEEVMSISYQGIVNKLHLALKALRKSPHFQSLINTSTQIYLISFVF